MSDWTARIGVAVVCLALTAGLGLGLIATSACANGLEVVPAELDWTRIATTGDPAPGGEPSDSFARFEDVQVLADGTTYFVGTIVVGPFDVTRSLFRWTPQGGIVRVYPDAIGATVAGSDPPLVQRSIRDERDLQYSVGADGSLLLGVGAATEFCVPGFALLASDGPGPLALVAQSGELVPAFGPSRRLASRLAGSSFADRPAARSGDAFLFHARAEDDPCAAGPIAASATGVVARGGDGAVEAVALAGSGAPEIAGAILDTDFAVSGGEAGTALVRTRVRLGPSGPFADAYYRWSAQSGLELLAREGQPAPSGGVLRFLDSAVLAEDGSLLFQDEQSASPGGIYRVDPQKVLHEIARIGGAVPGAEGSTFASFGVPVFASNGAGAISAAIDTPAGSRFGLWALAPDGSLVPRILDLDAPSGSGYGPIAIATGGRILYASGFAYFVSDAPGSATRLAALGDAFEFADGAPQVAIDLDFAVDPSLRRITATATGIDSVTQGLFTTDVPEPRTAGAAALLGVIALGRLRARRCV